MFHIPQKMGNCFRTLIRYSPLGSHLHALQQQDDDILAKRKLCERRLEIEYEKDTVLDRQIQLHFDLAIREHRTPTSKECLQVNDIQRKKKSVQKAMMMERRSIALYEGSRDIIAQEKDNVRDLTDVEAVVAKVKAFQTATGTPGELVGRMQKATQEVGKIRFGQEMVSAEKEGLASALSIDEVEMEEGSISVMQMFEKASAEAMQRNLASMPIPGAAKLSPTQRKSQPLHGVVLGV